jgi:hypothetical protein
LTSDVSNEDRFIPLEENNIKMAAQAHGDNGVNRKKQHNNRGGKREPSSHKQKVDALAKMMQNMASHLNSNRGH